MMEVNLIRSETWSGDNFDNIHKILDQTISDFVQKNDRIINIETKERNGAYRFWIYVLQNN
jgi:hypothetical protein